MTIDRRHSETEFPEFIENKCERLTNVGTLLEIFFFILFVQFSSIMYKFFIDEGERLLFNGENNLTYV